MKKYYNKIESMIESMNLDIEKLEERRDAIEDNAAEHDRDMTDREQGRYDALDEKIDALNDIISDLESVMCSIEDLCD